MLLVNQSFSPPVWACPSPPLSHTNNHTQGTSSYDAFYGVGRKLAGWANKLQIKYLNDFQTQRCLSLDVLVFHGAIFLGWCEVVRAFAYRCVYICPESVSLHVSAAAMQAPLWGFWLWAWCVYMVSGVCTNDQQVCSIVSASSVLYWIRVHNHTRLQASVQLCVWVLVSRNPIHFSLFASSELCDHMQAGAMSVAVLASYSSLPWDQKMFNQDQILSAASVRPLIKF